MLRDAGIPFMEDAADDARRVQANLRVHFEAV